MVRKRNDTKVVRNRSEVPDWGDCAPRGHLVISEHIFVCQNCVCVCATGI